VFASAAAPIFVAIVLLAVPAGTGSVVFLETLNENERKREKERERRVCACCVCSCCGGEEREKR
jgi:hypothetical protein